MSAGISVDFNTLFGQREQLLAKNVKVGETTFIKTNQRYIFYLVTKEKSTFDCKPSLQSLELSLKSLYQHCKSFGIKKLALPRIGSGIDGLAWYEVKTLIQSIFNNSGIEITIYYLSPSNAKKARQQRTRRLNELIPNNKPSTVNHKQNSNHELPTQLSPIPPELQLQYRSKTPEPMVQKTTPTTSQTHTSSVSRDELKSDNLLPPSHGMEVSEQILNSETQSKATFCSLKTGMRFTLN
ncbi:hypothetical protein B566_EDAN010892 [Ephemera danica]|nr:hypothetical protein B566_EDAN010892 [Ephemera danica]